MNYRRQYGYRNSGPNYTYILVSIVIVALLVLGVWGCADYHKESPVRITVLDKESVSTNEGHEYRVYTDDETYVVGDNLFKARFRSSNDYARLQRGHTYDCHKWGWRIPFFSMFENIGDCVEVQ